MKVSLTTNDSKMTVRIEGRLDTVAANDLEQALSPVWEQSHPDLYLDCRDMEYISSSGLRVFLKLKKYVLAQNGRLEVSELQPMVKGVFEMTGFDKLLLS